jgi:hypothetical protein
MFSTGIVLMLLRKSLLHFQRPFPLEMCFLLVRISHKIGLVHFKRKAFKILLSSLS